MHNFLRMENQATDDDDSLDDLSDDETSQAIVPGNATSSASAAYDIRERIADWCIAEGSVDFQDNMI